MPAPIIRAMMNPLVLDDLRVEERGADGQRRGDLAGQDAARRGDGRTEPLERQDEQDDRDDV